MAATSLLALIDDIASVLDDVGLLARNAVNKTAGVLGDDLALNAEQVSGVRADRELSVVWAVFKGSVVNKLILVPAALLLSVVLPQAISPFLMLGGAFLCFEGAEKVLHLFSRKRTAERREHLKALIDPEADLVKVEKEKIKGAVRTDFILSAEIVVIALGTVQAAPFLERSLTVVAVAAFVTVAVYLLVAAIVKMDDVGLVWRRLPQEALLASLRIGIGTGLLWIAPRLLKALSFLGTLAMFLVGGGILVHGVAPLGRFVHGAAHMASGLPTVGVVLGALSSSLLSGLFGLGAGVLLALTYQLAGRFGLVRAHE